MESRRPWRRNGGKFDFGSSIVICGVYGPVQASLKEELVDKALISVTFTPLAGAGGIFS